MAFPSDRAGNVCLAFLLAAASLWAASGDENWDSRFNQPILTHGSVSQLLVNGQDLYGAGRFFEAGGVAATNIAKWNGTNWSARGPDLRGGVSGLAVNGTNLYAAGFFQFPDQTNATGLVVASWNGVSWNTTQVGLWFASAVAPFGHGVCAAGGGTNSSGEYGYSVIHLDGTNRSTLAFITNGAFTSLALWHGDLVVSGNFDALGGVAATNLARWDGTNWSDVGGGVGVPGAGTYVNLAADEQWLYAGGAFTNVGGRSITNVARWDGTNWSAIIGGISFPTNGGFAALATGGGK